MPVFEIEALISARDGGNPWDHVVKVYAPDFLTMTILHEALEKCLPDTLNCQRGMDKVNHKFQVNVHCCTNEKVDRLPPFKFEIRAMVDRSYGNAADAHLMAYVTDMPSAMIVSQALSGVTPTFTHTSSEPNTRALIRIRLSIAPVMAGCGRNEP